MVSRKSRSTLRSRTVRLVYLQTHEISIPPRVPNAPAVDHSCHRHLRFQETQHTSLSCLRPYRFSVSFSAPKAMRVTPLPRRAPVSLLRTSSRDMRPVSTPIPGLVHRPVDVIDRILSAPVQTIGNKPPRLTGSSATHSAAAISDSTPTAVTYRHADRCYAEPRCDSLQTPETNRRGQRRNIQLRVGHSQNESCRRI